MSTANDFLQKLQSATVKSTVQQKQKSRPNASAAELSKMLMAATGQGESVLPETTSVTQMPVQEKKSHEAVKEKSGAADLSDKKAAASSFLQESVVRQEMSTKQKEKKTKLPLSESKENGDAGIASLIQKALAAKEKMQQAVPVMERVGGLRSEFEAVFQPQAEAMKAAASNTSTGPMMAFAGMNMANAAGGLNANTLFNMAAQEQAQAQPQQAAPAPQQSAPAAGEWICSCGAKNSGKFCTECGSKKPEPKPVEGWKCACGNIATGKFCPECGAPKPAEEKPAEPKGWTCSCGTVNQGKFCMNCGAKKPADAPLYRCDKCGWNPEDPKNPPRFCPECGDPFNESDIQ